MSERFLRCMSCIMLIILPAACSYQEQNAPGEMPVMIKVQLMVPEQASPGEAVSLQLKLTQGDAPVSDADQVQFQIWDKFNEPAAVSPEEGYMTVEKLEEQGALTASEVEDGIYEVEYTFEEPGSYVVQAHVTHGSMHSMPRKNVEVK